MDGSVETLERRVEELSARLERVEKWTGLVRTPRPARPPAPRPAPKPVVRRAPEPEPEPAPPARSLEDLVGGRVLAWAGGVAVALGIVLLFAIAVSRGWIGEGARTLFATCGSLALGTLGVWLHERRGRTDAALAATAASIAGLFVTVTVAAQVYDLVPAIVGLAGAMGVGAAAFVLAVRWRAPGIAALGLGGGLLAPVLAGAAFTPGTLALLWIAAAAATAVVLWQRWPWLSLGAFVLTTGQVAAYLAHDPPTTGVLVALIAFGALNAAAALGYELRVHAARLRPSSSLLLALNALVLAVAGCAVLDSDTATIWVAALAAAHLALGVFALRERRVAHEIALLACALGVVLADAALALALDGTPRAIAYAGGAVVIAGLARGLRAQGLDERVLGAGLGAHVCLAMLEALTGPARPEALAHAGAAPAAGLAAVVAVAAACLTAARLAGPERPVWRIALDTTGLAAIAYLSALSLDGAALAAGWAVEAIVLAGIARKDGDEVARYGAVGFLGLALGHALVFEAPPIALVDGLPDVLAAVLALGAATVALLALARDEEARVVALGGAALVALHLASTALISGAPGPQGQVLLSTLWGVTGTVALVAGLFGDRRALRLGALTLLFVALGKVAIYDLSALTAVARVGSCIALGLLLLLAAFVWQRLRPAGDAEALRA